MGPRVLPDVTALVRGGVVVLGVWEERAIVEGDFDALEAAAPRTSATESSSGGSADVSCSSCSGRKGGTGSRSAAIGKAVRSFASGEVDTGGTFGAFCLVFRGECVAVACSDRTCSFGTGGWDSEGTAVVASMGIG